MVRNLKITVEGRTYLVTVEDAANPVETMYPTTSLRTEVIEPAISEPKKPVAPAPAPAPAPAKAAAPVVTGGTEVSSPMTGVLIEFTVKVGDTVAANQQVATVEAMKMKTVVATPIAGKVLALVAEPGSTVDSGQAIVMIG